MLEFDKVKELIANLPADFDLRSNLNFLKENNFTFESIDVDEFKAITKLICVNLSAFEKQLWTFRSAAGNGKTFYGACCNRGVAEHIDIRSRVLRSGKCNCKANFSLNNRGDLNFSGQHESSCCKDENIRTNPTFFKYSTSSSTIEKLVGDALALKAKSPSLRPNDIMKQILPDELGDDIPSSFPRSIMTAVNAKLDEGMNQLRKAKKDIDDSISRAEAVNQQFYKFRNKILSDNRYADVFFDMIAQFEIFETEENTLSLTSSSQTNQSPIQQTLKSQNHKKMKRKVADIIKNASVKLQRR